MMDAELRVWVKHMGGSIEEAVLALFARAEAAEAKLAEATSRLEAHRDGAGAVMALLNGAPVLDGIQTLKAKLAAAEAREKALREALRRYGGHTFGCAVSRHRRPNPNCTCGFRAALAARKETDHGHVG